MSSESASNPACMRILRAHLIIWRTFGIWPQPTDTTSYRIYSVAVFLITSLIFNGCMLLSLIPHHSINESMECLLPASTTVMTTFKICLHMRNQQRLKQLFDKMQELEALLQTDTNATDAILDKAVRRAKILFVFFSCTNVWAIGMVGVIALYLGRLMWPFWIVYDWEHSSHANAWYYGLVGFQFVCNMFIGFMYITMNSYASILYIILTSYLQAVGDNASRIGARDGDAVREAAKLELRRCHDQHKMCITIGDMLNDLFGLHYFVHFGLSGLVICMTAYQLSAGQLTQEFLLFAFYCLYLFCMSLAIFLPCYFGSDLTAESEQLAVQTYRNGWLDQAKSVRMDMNLMVHCSQRPIRMWTYKKTCAIQLSTFVGVLRFAYSLFSCLIGM